MIECRHKWIVEYCYFIQSLADAVVVTTVCIVARVNHTWYKIVFQIQICCIVISIQLFLLYLYLLIYINFIHLLNHFACLIFESIDCYKQILRHINERNNFLCLNNFFIAARLAAKIFISILFLKYFFFIKLFY